MVWISNHIHNVMWCNYSSMSKFHFQFSINCRSGCLNKLHGWTITFHRKQWMWLLIHVPIPVNTLRPRQNGRHVTDDIFKCIFLNENIWIPTKISLNYVSYGLIDNMAALVQKMAWRRPGDKPLSEPMMGKFGDAYMRLSASMSQSVFKRVPSLFH